MLERVAQWIEAATNRRDKGNEGKYTKKILADYKNKRPVYDEFRISVHKLLDALLEEKKYKYQIVSRTKSLERLREKIIRRNGEHVHYRSLEDIEDLAGVRILFYSETDKERFVKELKKEVDGDLEIKERKQKSGYEATHVVMTLGEKRLGLSEYKHFSDLRVEVQATSILRHVWAEIEHDFIYKDINGLKQRDPQKFALMEKKLGEILEKYIKKASSDFEEVIKMADEA